MRGRLRLQEPGLLIVGPGRWADVPGPDRPAVLLRRRLRCGRRSSKPAALLLTGLVVVAVALLRRRRRAG